MDKRKIYAKECKLEAVRLLARGNKPAAELARELDILRNYDNSSSVCSFFSVTPISVRVHLSA